MAKPIYILLATFIILFDLSNDAVSGEVLNRVMSLRVLTMPSDANYPPQSFLNSDNEMDGFDIDVGKEIAKRLGVELKIINSPWEIITTGHWKDRWDISVGSMTPTKARAQVFDFPAIYYYVPATFAVHVNSSAQKLSDLNGKSIGVCKGCTYEAYLNKNLIIDASIAPSFTYQVTAGKVRSYLSDWNAFDNLRIGDGKRLDAILSSLPTISAAIKKGYPLRVIGDPVFFEPLAIAIDKGDLEFGSKISKIIDTMRNDGTLKNLSLKWYEADYTAEPKG